MSRTITISLYSTEKRAPLTTSLSLSRYPPVRNFIDCSTRRGVSRSPSRAGSSPMSASNRRTVSCIRSFYLLAVVACLVPLPAFAQAPTVLASIAKADELYRHRDDLASARQAADLYEKQATLSYEAAWKLSRAEYWLATAGTEKE